MHSEGEGNAACGQGVRTQRIIVVLGSYLLGILTVSHNPINRPKPLKKAHLHRRQKLVNVPGGATLRSRL